MIGTYKPPKMKKQGAKRDLFETSVAVSGGDAWFLSPRKRQELLQAERGQVDEGEAGAVGSPDRGGVGGKKEEEEEEDEATNLEGNVLSSVMSFGGTSLPF